MAPNLANASVLLRNMTRDLKGQGKEMLANLQVLLQNASFVGPAIAESSDPVRQMGPPIHMIWNSSAELMLLNRAGDVMTFSALLQRIQKLLDDRGPDLRILGEATSANVKLIAAALRNFDSSQILANLLGTVPEDGVIQLHMSVPQG